MSDFKNYTTKIHYERSIAEIKSMLMKYNVTKFMEEVTDGIISAVVFSIKMDVGELSYKLPCEVEKISNKLTSLKREGKLKSVTRKQAESIEHARNVGWRVIVNWIETQITMIMIDQVTLDQVFLPYAYDGKKIFYDRLKESNFELLSE